MISAFPFLAIQYVQFPNINVVIDHIMNSVLLLLVTTVFLVSAVSGKSLHKLNCMSAETRIMIRLIFLSVLVV